MRLIGYLRRNTSVAFVCRSCVNGLYATDFLCLRSACIGVSFLFWSTFECSDHAISSCYWYREICSQGQFTRFCFRYTAGCHAKGGRNQTPLLVFRRGCRDWSRHSVFCNLPIQDGWKYTISVFVGAFAKLLCHVCPSVGMDQLGSKWKDFITFGVWLFVGDLSR